MNLCYRELPGSTELRELIDRTMLMSDEDFEREHNWDREEREDFMLMLEDDARELEELEGIEESEYSIHDVDGALTTALGNGSLPLLE